MRVETKATIAPTCISKRTTVNKKLSFKGHTAELNPFFKFLIKKIQSIIAFIKDHFKPTNLGIIPNTLNCLLYRRTQLCI